MKPLKKILIVEDEKFLSEIYGYKLTYSGFDVVLADSAEKALEILKKKVLDLILLDVLLPGKSGIDFLVEIKKNPKFFFIPVLVFSNYDELNIQKKAKELGAKEYLIKSNYTPQEIVDKINKYIK